MSHTPPAQTRQPLRTAVTRNNSQLHFRLSQFRVAAGDAQRARQSQLAPAAQRETVDRGNRRFPQRLEAMNNFLSVQSKFPAVHRSLLRQFVDVRASDERFLARAG